MMNAPPSERPAESSSIGDAPPGSPGPGGWLENLGSLVVYDARTWLLIPLHLLVFMVLYFAGLDMLENGFLQAAHQNSKILLQDVVGEVPFLAPVRDTESGKGHLFAHLLAAHKSIDLRFYDLSGNPVAEIAPSESLVPSKVVEFARSGELDRFWLGPDPNTVEMQGLTQVVGDTRCEPCHAAGEPLALAGMSFDYTETFSAVRSQLKVNLLIMLVVWAMGVGVTNRLVRTSVGRSSRRLQGDLDAALKGQRNVSPRADLVLDPKLAEIHQSLRRFLDRQLARDSLVSDRLEQTDRLASLGQLAAGLAHEIKNPLAGIQGALEILRQDLPEDSPNFALCDRMLEEMDRVDQILKLLLTSARPSPPRLAETDVTELLAKVRLLLVHGLRKRGVDLKVVVTPGLEPAWIDDAKIQQVLVNLISNAGEAIEGQGQVVVTAAPFPNGDGLILTVEDDGPGLAEETRARIFEPFFTTKFSGTGLGLTIARRLIEQHQGRLQVESTLGSGTTFFVLLPDVSGRTTDDVDTMTENGIDDGADSSG